MSVREGIEAPTDNPAGIDGIEFVEYSTSRPQALGQVLDLMGFRPVARHRSREVMLYRQGAMNVVINAHDVRPPIDESPEAPVIAAVAFRVRDAARAHRRAVEGGAWPVATHVEAMELNIPAIHGVSGTRIYFVDRYREFSIYSVDFVPIPAADQAPPAIAGLHWFGLVQYVSFGRIDPWTEFYRTLLGFRVLPEGKHFGILPNGRILQSPCGRIYLQLVAPDPNDGDFSRAERLERVGLGAPDVPKAVRALSERGVEFHTSERVHVEESGALTRPWLGGLMFELVRDPGGAAT